MSRLFFIAAALLVGACSAQATTTKEPAYPNCPARADKCAGAYVAYKPREGTRPFRVLRIPSRIWYVGTEYSIQASDVQAHMALGAKFYEKDALPPHLQKIYDEQLKGKKPPR